jgi:flagellar hook-associated protein 2
VAKGLAAQMSDYFSYVTDTSSGAISAAENTIQSNIDQIKKDIADMQESLQTKEDQLSLKFAAMESALSQLKSQGDYLTSQFAAATNNWGSKK